MLAEGRRLPIDPGPVVPEAEARARGCIGATLGTYDFQARPFYEKQGYEVFGTLEPYPNGHCSYYLRKIF